MPLKPMFSAIWNVEMTHRSIYLCDVPVVSDVRRFRSEEAKREELSKETRAERAHRKAQIKRDSLQPF